MSFGQAIASGFRNYVVWKGRASRSEFWYWVLFWFIGSFATELISRIFGITAYTVEPGPAGEGVYFSSYHVGLLSTIWALALFLPSISVAVRRFHDTGHSGWWWWLQLLNFLCFIGTIILVFAFWIRRGDEGENTYGPPPNA